MLCAASRPQVPKCSSVLMNSSRGGKVIRSSVSSGTSSYAILDRGRVVVLDHYQIVNRRRATMKVVRAGDEKITWRASI